MSDSSSGVVVAIVGATGLVGQRMLEILDQRDFPVKSIVPFASERSKGKPIKYRQTETPCRVLEPGCFDGVDIAFFDASDEVSIEWVPQAAESGAWVVDNSAAFRNEDDLPLIVPEVNGDLISDLVKNASTPRDRIISGPNCSTAQLVVALEPIKKKWGIERVVTSTYQSVSGAGVASLDELKNQSIQVIEGKEVSGLKTFPHQMAYNCIPQIGRFLEDGYSSEEHKMMRETRKMLRLPELKITVTTVRVPTLWSHAESVNIETEKPFELSEMLGLLKDSPGIEIVDDPARGHYPLNETEPGCEFKGATGRDPVIIGRIRKDSSVDHGVNMWVVADNLRKGAALNAVQIAEELLRAQNTQ